jgi:hypothetical protein
MKELIEFLEWYTKTVKSQIVITAETFENLIEKLQIVY